MILPFQVDSYVASRNHGDDQSRMTRSSQWFAISGISWKRLANKLWLVQGFPDLFVYCSAICERCAQNNFVKQNPDPLHQFESLSMIVLMPLCCTLSQRLAFLMPDIQLLAATTADMRKRKKKKSYILWHSQPLRHFPHGEEAHSSSLSSHLGLIQYFVICFTTLIRNHRSKLIDFILSLFIHGFEDEGLRPSLHLSFTCA